MFPEKFLKNPSYQPSETFPRWLFPKNVLAKAAASSPSSFVLANLTRCRCCTHTSGVAAKRPRNQRARALVTHLVTRVCDSISRCCVFLQAIGRIALQNFKVLHACALKRKEEPFACDCCGDTCDSFSCCLVEGGGLIISKWVPDWVLCIRWMPELEGRKNQSGESIERQQRNHHLKT